MLDNKSRSRSRCAWSGAFAAATSMQQRRPGFSHRTRIIKHHVNCVQSANRGFGPNRRSFLHQGRKYLDFLPATFFALLHVAPQPLGEARRCYRRPPARDRGEAGGDRAKDRRNKTIGFSGQCRES